MLPTADADPADGLLAQRIALRQPQIQKMVTRGWTVSAIARELQLDRKTVRRYARAGIDDLMRTGVRRRSLIDPFVPYLQRRWSEGCVNAATLYAEIKAQGFRGSVKTVRRHLQHWRVAGAPAVAPPAITPRKAGWRWRATRCRLWDMAMTHRPSRAATSWACYASHNPTSSKAGQQRRQGHRHSRADR